MLAEYKHVIGKSVIPQGAINVQQNYERQNYFLYICMVKSLLFYQNVKCFVTITKMGYALNLHKNYFKWKTTTWSIQEFQSYKKKIYYT